MNCTAAVKVMLKKTVLDPQGAAIGGGLRSMGFDAVTDVRVGKSMEVTLAGVTSMEEAARLIDEMCRKLLANPVIEEYTFEVFEAGGSEGECDCTGGTRPAAAAGGARKGASEA
ncbi:MAG: phosphoribosylformylglycinamidine synthase subunit PurS [Firmicutes bacterium]|nr:phosphoribosylformylglycinamidine synthase subunit PurS [Bacillota bacterium]